MSDCRFAAPSFLGLVVGLLACQHDSSEPSPTPPAGAAVATVEVSAPATTLLVGTSVQLTVRLLDADGIVLTNRTVTWSASDGELVSVTSTGLVTARAPGDVTVQATSEGKAGEVLLTVAVPPANTGTIQITTTTTGDAQDADGYLISVGSGVAQAIGANATHSLAGLTPGSYVITISGTASNCSVTTANPLTVLVTADQVTQITFQVTCAAPPKKIAFASTRDGNAEIYVMDPDGSNLTRLTTNTVSEQAPEWSPDGQRLVYQSDVGGYYDLFVMNADGTNKINLTNTPAINDEFGTWAPEGTRIAYQSDGRIFIMNADGTSPTQVGNQIGIWPVWSPDGSRIAFSIYSPGESYDIYVIQVDGTNLTRLTTSPGYDAHPAWSPDGTKIAFSSDRTGAFQIFVMNADGTAQTRISSSEVNDQFADWSSDGATLIFHSERGDPGQWNLFTMRLDGSMITPLTSNAGHNYFPSWQR